MLGRRHALTSYRVRLCTLDHIWQVSATFDDDWKAKVVADAGAHYLKPASDLAAASRLHNKPTRAKLTIRGVAP